MNAVRLVCTDLDGTLLNSAGAIGDVTLEALSAAESSGLMVRLVTGRPARDTVWLAREYGLTGPVACSNGAVVVDAATGDELWRGDVAPDLVSGCLEKLRSAMSGVLLGIDTSRGLILDTGFADLVPDCWPHEAVPDVRHRVFARPDNPVVKILAAHPVLGPDKLSELFGGVTGLRCTYSTPHFVELSTNGIDKGTALRRLADLAAVPLTQTAAVGDMPNDLPMLSTARIAAAVANAHASVRRQADLLLPSNDDDGVAELIRLLI